MIGIDKKWLEDCKKVHAWEGVHLFLGCHCMPQCRQYFLLPCNILNQGRSKKMKIKIFGRRFYPTLPVERIAYVDPKQVKTVAERLI